MPIEVSSKGERNILHNVNSSCELERTLFVEINKAAEDTLTDEGSQQDF